MKIAIIGSGISGLTAANNFIKAGHDVVIYEKEKESGGIARGYKEPEWQNSLENFYHHWFTKDKALLDLMEELGLRSNVEFHSPKTVMYYKGKFYPFDSIPAALLFPGLGFGINKIRFGLVGVYLRITRNWKKLEQVTAKEWMTKYAGDFVYRTMWEPMMIGKFGEEYADKINMAWLWARIFSRTTKLGTYRGGMQLFFDQFTEILKKKGVQFRFETAVEQILKKEDSKLSVTAGGLTENYDKVLVTTSPTSMLNLVPQLPDKYKNQLGSLKSIGAVVISVALKHPLSPEGYYWYNLPKNEGYPFLALVEHTNYVSPERFGGETIIYAGDYLAKGHPYFNMPVDEILKKLIPGFKKINPAFSEDWILHSHKFSTEYAQPIPFVNQSKNIPDTQTPIDGLYFLSMSQIYPWDRGMNFAISFADSLSRAIS